MEKGQLPETWPGWPISLKMKMYIQSYLSNRYWEKKVRQLWGLSSMVKQCAYGTCRSDTRYPARLEGHVVFFSHFQSPKHRRKGASCGLNSVGDPTPNSIYRKIHICLLQNKLSCLQLASYLSGELRELLGMMTNYLVERTSPNSYGAWQLVLLPSDVHN